MAREVCSAESLKRKLKPERPKFVKRYFRCRKKRVNCYCNALDINIKEAKFLGSGTPRHGHTEGMK
jgi:hypothetical protein